MKKTLVFMDIYTGKVFDTYRQAFMYGIENYDLDDNTNILQFEDCFREIWV